MISRNEKNEHLKSLLDLSVFYPDDVVEFVRRGANPNVKNSSGLSPLHLFVKNNLNGCFNNQIEELVKHHDAKIEIKTKEGLTPLQYLIRYCQCTSEDILNLVRLGADPNTKNVDGLSLLHFFVTNNKKGSFDKTIETLVKTYHADINILDDQGFTPLQRLMNFGAFTLDEVKKLIRLGADPYFKNSRGISLIIEKDTAANKELQDCLRRKNIKEETFISKQKQQDFRKTNTDEFLNLLILLTMDWRKKDSLSPLKKLPEKAIYNILSFLAIDIKGRTREDGYELAEFFFTHPHLIKEMLGTPGGVNVMQRYNKHSQKNEFTFFKSAQTFCEDYKKRKAYLIEHQEHKNPGWDWLIGKKLTNTSVELLDEFKEYALRYWHEQSSLYKKSKNNSQLLTQLLESIQDKEPYNHTEIQPYLHLKAK